MHVKKYDNKKIYVYNVEVRWYRYVINLFLHKYISAPIKLFVVKTNCKK